MEQLAFLNRTAAAFERAPDHRQGIRPPRIMLLTSSLGTGHSRAALAIERELKVQLPECSIHTIDFWSLMDPEVSRAIKSTYLRLVTDHSDLYHRLYQLDQRYWRETLERGQALPSLLHDLHRFIDEPVFGPTGARYWLDRLLFRQLSSLLANRGAASKIPFNHSWQQKVLTGSWNLLAGRLHREIQHFRPDALVATQVNMGALAANLKGKGKIAMPLTAVMTDFGVHDFWMQEHIDSYCVTDESMESAGILRSRSRGEVDVTGIPLMPDFTELPSMSEARRLLGLPGDRPVILILGGGLGLGVADIVGHLAQRLSGVSREPLLVVLAGRNQLVSHELKEQPVAGRALARKQIQVHGWTDRMAAFMRAADIVVGKPGGLTTAEVLACGRPLFSTSCLRGQESFNVDYLERNKVGQLLSAEDLSRIIFPLLEDRAGLQSMQTRAWSLGKRHGAAAIAARVIESACAARHAGVAHTQQ